MCCGKDMAYAAQLAFIQNMAFCSGSQVSILRRIYPCRPIFFAQKLMHHPLGHILPTQDSRLYFNRVFYLTYIYVFNIHLRFFDRTGYQNETGKRIVFLLRILRSFRFEKLAVFSECVSYASFHQVSVRRNSQFSMFAPHMHLKEKGVRKHLTP